MGKTKIKINKQNKQEETSANEVETQTAANTKPIKSRGNKYKSAKALVDKNKLYSIPTAISLLAKTSISKFEGSVELHAVIKKQGFSSTVKFPHEFGKQKKVVVVNDEIIKSLESGKVDFDVLLATPETMPKIVKFAKILGPKGLMPNPKNGTLIKNEADVSKFSSSQTTIKTEKTAPVIHLVVGKTNMKEKEIQKNLETAINSLGKNQILKAYLAPTMGPSVKLDIN